MKQFNSSRRVAQVMSGATGKYSQEDREEFWAEIASTYLPCLVRTWLENGQDVVGDEDLPIWYLYPSFLTQALSQPSGARFAREQTEESVATYERALQSLEIFFDTGFVTRRGLDVNAMQHNKNTVQGFLDLLDVLAFTLAVHLPSISDLPPLPNSTRLKIRSFWSDLRQGWALTQRKAAEKARLTLTHMLRDSYNPLAGRSLNRGYGTNWFTCEVVRLVKEEGSKAGRCVEIEEGEEMSTCG